MATRHAPMQRRARPIPLGDTDPFTPDAARPVRVRARSLSADAHFDPHRHPWGQLAYCTTGILQAMAAPDEPNLQAVTYIVPPSRAVWFPPGMRHAVTVREAAEFRTLYVHADAVPAGWTSCRMIVVSPLLRELIQAMDAADEVLLRGGRVQGALAGGAVSPGRKSRSAAKVSGSTRAAMNCRNGSAMAGTAVARSIWPLFNGSTPSRQLCWITGSMTNHVRNSARLTISMLGGACWTPMAWPTCWT